MNCGGRLGKNAFLLAKMAADMSLTLSMSAVCLPTDMCSKRHSTARAPQVLSDGSVVRRTYGPTLGIIRSRFGCAMVHERAGMG